MRKSIVLLSLALALMTAACAEPRIAPAGDRPGPASLADRHLVTGDGLALPLRVWRPEGQARAVVLGLHGFNDYSGAFREVGPKLAAAGVALYAYDQRGFGAAPGRGLWHGADRMQADAAAALRLLRAEAPGRPVFLLGLSMGGAVAMTVLADAPGLADGAMLVGPAVRGRDSLPFWQRWSLDVAAGALPWYPLTGQGLAIQPTDNIAALRQMARDPHVIKETRVDALYGLVDLMTAAERAAPRQTTPLLLLYGLKDDLVPKGPTLKALNALPPPTAGAAAGTPGLSHRVAVYQGGRHMLLRDLDSDRTLADMLAWMQDPAAPLPSGADAKAAARLAAAATN